jgi:transposase-like protein
MKYTIKDFRAQFPNDAACLAYIFNQKHPEGSTCPKCGRKDSYTLITKRRAYACICGHQIHPTGGTIFHKSRTSLQTWFFAMFLMTASKNGISAMELQRQVGVTYKTAWRMAHQIRQLMNEDVKSLKLSGVVEADETFIGGLEENKHASKRKHAGRGATGKATVIGVAERGGSISAKVVRDNSRPYVIPHIMRQVAKGSTVMTDEHAAYNILPVAGYGHETVKHGDKEYVRGAVHTNSIEGFWSQLKRSINGTFHQVSPKHLQKYVNEFAYRYNRRRSETPMFSHLSASVAEQHAPAV